MAEIFPKAGLLRRGYDRETVDQFFAQARAAYEGGIPAEQFSASQVRQASFELRRGGYDTRSVDSALNRLEAAFTQRDKVDYISVNGEANWYAKVAESATTLYPRLLRPDGARFSHPPRGEKGYRTDEVDALMHRITLFFDQNQPLTVGDVRLALFHSAKGEKAYREDQVDAYLGRVVEIILAAS
ncbi:DivIVA domain-containing protein [Scrofimicrobium sp. R131]|uniref:DivIVA domain-containing protein n=1 Tax=Scrofimicrobium appendicitidis TaxID=3079930 RepID=A0AAU7VBJ3_9ACTO